MMMNLDFIENQTQEQDLSHRFQSISIELRSLQQTVQGVLNSSGEHLMKMRLELEEAWKEKTHLSQELSGRQENESRLQTELNAVNEVLALQKATIDEKIREVSELHKELSRERHQKIERVQLAEKYHDLENQIEKETQIVSELRAQIQHLQKEILRIQSDADRKIAEKNESFQFLQDEYNRLRNQFQTEKAEKEKIRTELVDERKTVEKRSSDLKASSERIFQLQSALKAGEGQAHAQELFIRSQKAELQAATEKLEHSAVQVKELTAQIRQLETEKQALLMQGRSLEARLILTKQQNTELSGNLNSTRDIAESSKKTIQNLQKDKEALQKRNFEVESELHTLKGLASQWGQVHSAFQNEIQAYKEKAFKTETELQTSRESLRILELHLQEMEKKSAKLENEAEISRQQLQSFEKNHQHQEILRLRSEVGQLQAEKMRLSEELKALQDDHQSLKEVTDVRAAQSRELQLKQYAGHLNQTKREIRNLIERFRQEIKLAETANPLIEYLKVTEREISRVDLQLKKTPTSSPDRARLEQALTELYEQRDFLRQGLEKSRSEVDNRLRRIQALLTSEGVLPMPPPPPQI